MKYRNAGILAAAFACAMAWTLSADAQPMQVVPTCGSITLAPGAGVNGTIDTTGRVCSNGGTGAGGTGSTTLIPSAAAVAGITPVVSTALENAHILKATAGNLYSVYSTNLTGGASGFLLIFNAATAPPDGAVTPLVCVPFTGGVASANYQGLPPAVFSTGMVAVVSSGANCFTKLTGTLTAFISGLVM
jgi:hypothetical protein